MHAHPAKRILAIPTGGAVPAHFRFAGDTSGCMGALSCTPDRARFAASGNPA